MITTIIYSLVGLFGLLYLADFFFSLRDDPREPPRLRARIPLVGHLIGLLSQSMGYYSNTSKQTDAEIYTLGLFHLKIYVCNTRRLMPIIQRHGKTLSFTPVIQLTSRWYADCSDRTHDLYGEGLAQELNIATRNALAPGPGLDAQNLRMGQEVKRQLDDLAKKIESGNKSHITLLEWVRHTVIQASAHGIYGSGHMFKDNAQLERDFWTWHDYNTLMGGPKIFALPGWKSRERIFEAVRQYLENGIPEDAALVLEERQRIWSDAGIPLQERAQLESSFIPAVVANTTPTQYWFIYDLFCRPRLLAEVREEIQANAVSGTEQDGFLLDVAALKSQCPIFLSTLQESQRTRLVHANIRKVMEDTLLDDRYLLKKGNFLQMPGSPIHASTEIYGPTADIFDPYRFVPKPGQKELPHSSFLAWGAPPHLCPARQFASTEMLILTAMLALRFDLLPVAGSWDPKPALRVGELATTLSPKHDFEVRIAVREQYGTADWRLNMGESKSRVLLASG